MVSTTLASRSGSHAGNGLSLDRILRRAAAAALAILSVPARIYRSRQLMQTLASMNAHELADIGLSRQDLADSGGLPLTSELGSFFAARASARRRRSR